MSSCQGCVFVSLSLRWRSPGQHQFSTGWGEISCVLLSHALDDLPFDKKCWVDFVLRKVENMAHMVHAEKQEARLFSWFHRYAAAVACNFHTSWAYLLFDCWKLLWHGWSNTSDFRPTVDAMSWSENTCPSLSQSIRWFALLFPLGILPPWSPRPRPALLMCLDSGNAWRKWRERIQCWRVNCRMLRFVSLWWLIKGWTGTDSRDVIYCDFYLSKTLVCK